MNQATTLHDSATDQSVPDVVPVRHALVSVFDKARLADLLGRLSDRGVTLYSTGGTFQEIQRHLDSRPGAAPFDLVAISDYTGYPEMPGGLVKTLHPKIHAGILAEPGQGAQRDYLAAIGAIPFDLVVCNLYPFEKVAATPGATIERLRQNIDIGGPTMLRAAAKNFLRVATVVDPADYDRLGEEISGGGISLATRLYLAQKAFRHVRDYDDAICGALDPLDVAALEAGYRIAR